MAPTVLVIQNDPICPLGLFATWLSAAGTGVDIRRGFADDDLPGETRGYGGVIVLGGAMSAHDDASCRWLPATKELIRAAVRYGTPLLGICLGQQLAALALGGAVARNPAGRARGLTSIMLTDAGRADKLLGAVPAGARAIQWNSDIVTTPPVGSAVLATCADGSPQAIRFARRAWGVQFHPEASADIFGSWLTVADDETAAAVREIYRAESSLATAWRPFAHRFAELCLGGDGP